MLQQSEIVSLLMGLALLPVVWASVRRLSFAGKGWLSAAVLLLIASWVFTVAEAWVLPDQLNLLEHAAFAASMIAFAVGLTRLAREERSAVSR